MRFVITPHKPGQLRVEVQTDLHLDINARGANDGPSLMELLQKQLRGNRHLSDSIIVTAELIYVDLKYPVEAGYGGAATELCALLSNAFDAYYPRQYQQDFDIRTDTVCDRILTELPGLTEDDLDLIILWANEHRLRILSQM